MKNQEQFLALLLDSLKSVRDPRFFATERGFQGEMLAQLRNRIEQASLPGAPIVEQEYQKTIPLHGLKIRPDIIVHVPFERGGIDRRDQGNFVAIELKLRADETEARTDFAKLAQMKEVLGYPLTIFINIGGHETYFAACPAEIAGQTICYAVRIENGDAAVRIGGPATR